MILYNLSYNGPYEYDKFILNICQLYNLVEDEKIKFAAAEIHDQIKKLDEIIKEKTICDSVRNINTQMDRIMLLDRARGRK